MPSGSGFLSACGSGDLIFGRDLRENIESLLETLSASSSSMPLDTTAEIIGGLTIDLALISAALRFKANVESIGFGAVVVVTARVTVLAVAVDVIVNGLPLVSGVDVFGNGIPVRAVGGRIDAFVLKIKIQKLNQL
jgi:hypothetical protein